MCRDLSPRRSALLELELGELGLGRLVSAGAVCLFFPGCLSRVRVDHKPSRALGSFLSIAAAAAVCVPRFASEALRIGSEAKRSVTPAGSLPLLWSFHLPAVSFRGLLLILPAAISDRGCSSSPAASPCAAPLTSTPNLPVAISPVAASASIGHLIRARGWRVRESLASVRSGCCSGDLCSVADSGCAGSRPPQGRKLPLLGLPLARRGSRRALRSGDRGEGMEARSPAIAGRQADGPLGPGLGLMSCLGRVISSHTLSGSAASGGKSVRNPAEGSAEPRRGVLAAPAASRGLRPPYSRRWRVLRASGAVCVSAAPKRKAPFGASLVRSCSRRFCRRRPVFRRTATSWAVRPVVVNWSPPNVHSLSQSCLRGPSS